MDDRTAKGLREAWQLKPPQTRVSWRRRFWGIAFLLLVAAAAAWWIYGSPAPQQPATRSATAAPVSVIAASVATGDINITQNALGTVTSLATVTIRTQISGYLSRVDFTEGQEVQKGDLLAEIDSRSYEAALQQMQGQLARDQALLEGAKVDLERYGRLVAQKAIPQQQFDTQQALVKQYEGQVAADEGQVNTAKVNLAYCRILAPVSGRIGLRQVDQGNYVTPGDQNGLALITQIKPISVIFTIPEDSMPQIRSRLHAGATLPVIAYDRSGTSKLATGTLTTVDNQLDTTTGTLKLRAQFPNDDESLFPNQFVNAQLVIDVMHDATVLPIAAVQRGAPGTFVYLIKDGDTVSVRPVELGPSDGDRVAVRTGVAPGDRVVVDGADRLREGSRVSLRDRNSNQAAPAGSGAPKRSGAPKGSPEGSPNGSPNGSPKGTPKGSPK
jgi:membrane fusion protein, multidrug efflux system